jgi:hypothetical protein
MAAKPLSDIVFANIFSQFNLLNGVIWRAEKFKSDEV